MKWWKKALIVSAVWTVILGVFVFCMEQRIKREAVSQAHRDAWEAKLGQMTGILFGGGSVAVWLFFKKGQRRKSLER